MLEATLSGTTRLFLLSDNDPGFGTMQISVIRAAERLGREHRYVTGTAEDPVPAPVLAWQQAVHTPGIYDLEVDTSVLSPEACADAIRRRLAIGPQPTALERLRAVGFSPP